MSSVREQLAEAAEHALDWLDGCGLDAEQEDASGRQRLRAALARHAAEPEDWPKLLDVLRDARVVRKDKNPGWADLKALADSVDACAGIRLPGDDDTLPSGYAKEQGP